ncbi:cholecystokinin receptor type A-like [Saccostrea echinata]|uniref:cholecystokinin receptor type A-like n=1 Tax=Saccostrea echinata TaxID=191078 RepID=UPI002A81FA61|nr:cholecystokinin receptor type A-like [Saccostrea echinata]
MENYTNQSLDELRVWNSALATILIPNNVILSLYMIAGFLGNSTVIFIYGLKIKGNKEERYFIPFLATADLCASLVCASFGIAQNMMQATFDNEPLCKTWWFFAGSTTLISVFLLIIIAVHRYLKVCKPLGKQMTLKWKRLALVLCLAVAFPLAGPMTYFYGSESFVKDDEMRIYGRRCGRLSTTNKTGSLLYGGVLVLTAITIIVVLTCLYSKIGFTIVKRFKYKKAVGNNSTTEQPRSRFSSGDAIAESEQDIHSVETDSTVLSSSHLPQASIPTKGKVIPTNTNQRLKHLPLSSSTKRRRNRRTVHRFTLMFMLITVIFLICYIPKVIIMLLEANNTKFWEGFSEAGRSAVSFVYRIYILNNVTNPFIYAFLDKKFSEQIKKLFKLRKSPP